MDSQNFDQENEDIQKEETYSKEEDNDGEVNLDAKLVCAWEEIDRLKGNIKNNDLLHKYERKDHNYNGATIIVPKIGS